MRKIVWSEYISLDGSVDPPGEWSIPCFSDHLPRYQSDELFASDALPLGETRARDSRRRGRRWRRSGRPAHQGVETSERDADAHSPAGDHRNMTALADAPVLARQPTQPSTPV
jgi:hypothetical protein